MKVNERLMKAVDNILNELTTAVDEAGRSYHRLVLLIGPSNSGKTQLLRQLAEESGCDVLNVNLKFSQRMLDVARSRRPKQADRVFREIITSQSTDLVLLDNLEVLFDTALQLDPLRLLQLASRNKTVVASWNGTLNDGLLSYAEPDHSEYKSYKNVDVITVLAGTKTLNN